MTEFGTTVLLSSLFGRLAIASDTLQAASREIRRKEQALNVHVKIIHEHFQDTVTNLIAKIHEHATSKIAAVRVLCQDRVKVLDARADVLTVSAGQMTACVARGKAAFAQGRLLSVIHALDAARGVKELCQLETGTPVSVNLDITADTHGVMYRTKGMAVLRLYDIDGCKSSVSGAGLVSCVKGEGVSNEVKVTCVNSAGETAGWVTAVDVWIVVRNDVGEVIGRGVGGQVIANGEIRMQYEVEDVVAEEVELSVGVGSVVVHGGPWRVFVWYSAVKSDAAYIKSYNINRTETRGFTVTLDGKHFVVSNCYHDSISVYSMNTGDRVTTFGSNGSGAGEFNMPTHVCSTPRGTILVCEYSNRRVQEVTITGEHVRFIGVGHFDDNVVFAMCMQGDMVAVGKRNRDTNGLIVLFNYSSGALIRKFGSYGFGEGQVKNVTGLSFTPDGKHILVADISPRLSMFTVEGAFVKTLGTGVLDGVWGKDVLCSGSSIFATNVLNHCICVFSAETGALIRT